MRSEIYSVCRIIIDFGIGSQTDKIKYALLFQGAYLECLNEIGRLRQSMPGESFQILKAIPTCE